MPETPLLAVRCPIDVLDQIESEKNLTGRSKTDVVIDRLRNSIPSLAVTDRHKLPAIAAIYQVFTSDNNLLYIGITDNLKQDWESHPLYGQFLESDVNSRITWYNSDLPVIDPNLVKKYNSVSDTVNTDRDSHSENMVSSDQLEYAIANSEIIKGIQSKLDDMERLLRLQREASIA
ncbi:GIY-YIG nuclease family protein, partial [Microcystis aeruginosa BLCCF158]|nr:GIY-YIG nuclease family protein [Microcystis aeruginosa BLCC-F158]